MDQSIHATPLGRELRLKDAAASLAAEWRFLTIVIVLVLVLTSLPYVFAYLTTPPDMKFMGIMLDVPDHGQYFSWMRELTAGHLASNKLTPEPNRPIFFNLLWWGLGRLGSLLGWGYEGVYQLLRIGSAVLFLLLAYAVCAWFLPRNSEGGLTKRRLAFLLLTFTSGFGWILVVIKYLLRLPQVPFPLDLYVAEGNTFLSILGYPHFIAAALYICTFGLVWQGERKNDLRYAVAAGLVAFFFGWQHAYDLLLVWGILGAYAGLKLLRDRRVPFYLIWSILIIGGLSIWPALYSVILTNADPVWEGVLAQFSNADVYTPNPLHLPVLLGPVFLLALLRVARKNPLRLASWDDKSLFLLGWFGANLFLIYIPTDFQIHMLNGWQVPMAILAAQAVFTDLIPWLQSRADRGSWKNISWQRVAPALVLLAVIPTNLYLLAWRFVDLSTYTYPYYLHTGEVEALRWLESVGQPSDVVLSSLAVGQYLPALTGQNAFLAHWAQTLDFYGKKELVQSFFDASVPDSARLQIVQQFGVDYVIYGPAEKLMGGYDPGGASFLSLVFEKDGVEIYAIP